MSSRPAYPEIGAWQLKTFWMIAREIDQVYHKANYVDERLCHRVHCLCLGLNLLGQIPPDCIIGNADSH